jgi:hypothetical protein
VSNLLGIKIPQGGRDTHRTDSGGWNSILSYLQNVDQCWECWYTELLQVTQG